VIDHIVNYNVPETVEDYVHRAGRTARGTAGGAVSTIATWKDREQVRAIEQALGKPLPRCAAPGVEPYVEKSKSAPRRRLR
jgi:ATP-dependent RNA helicase RhlE